MNHFRKHYKLLEYIQNQKGRNQEKFIKDILNKAPYDVIKCIEECCINIAERKIILEESEKNKLQKFAPVIAKIGRKDLRKKLSKKQRKNLLLNQSGGFLQYLIAPALKFLAGLLGFNNE